MRVSGFVLLALFLTLLSIPPVHGDDTPVIGAYFYLFDIGYDQALSVSDEIPWDQINRLYIAFATVRDGNLTNIESEGSESANSRIRNVVALCRQKNPRAEIFISSNYGDAVTKEYLEAAKDPDRFAESVLAYLQDYDLDGYDMDWEDRDSNEYTAEQVALLQVCDTTFKAPGLLTPRGRQYGLTCTIWPGVHDPDTVASYADYVDQLNLMTYGPGDAYDLKTYATQYAEAGVPYGKMIGGVESEFGYQDNGGHDTSESVAEKGLVVQSLGLAGLMSWRIDSDMATPDGVTEEGPPTFQVTRWVYHALVGDEERNASSPGTGT